MRRRIVTEHAEGAISWSGLCNHGVIGRVDEGYLYCLMTAIVVSCPCSCVFDEGQQKMTFDCILVSTENSVKL